MAGHHAEHERPHDKEYDVRCRHGTSRLSLAAIAIRSREIL